MKVKFVLKLSRSEEIKFALLRYIAECRKAEEEGEAYLFVDRPDEIRARLGYYDGEVVYYPEDDRIEYTTHSGMGYYDFDFETRSVFFEGRRNSFKDGTALFCIEEEDCNWWQIIESREPGRSPWA